MSRKIAIIVIGLVKESEEVPNNKVEEEILRELGELMVPWMERVDKVTVLESNEN